MRRWRIFKTIAPWLKHTIFYLLQHNIQLQVIHFHGHTLISSLLKMIAKTTKAKLSSYDNNIDPTS